MKEVQTIKKIKVKRKQAKSSNYVWIESKKPHQSNCEHGDIVTFTQAKEVWTTPS
jgi:aerobic-type carbon monoxide dehydrogenase small subunit (CoxS/CutS family)